MTYSYRVSMPPVIPERSLHPGDAPAVHGCTGCAWLWQKRIRARIYLNPAGVEAANAAIRRHPYH